MSTTTEKKHFDLHTTGIGYLNRIREVKPKKGKKGDSFLACNIAALKGHEDEVSYVYFDCRVSGKDAQKYVRRCEAAVNAKKKVLIGFKLGDLWVDSYPITNGENAGKTGFALKARLLFISWIKVNGEEVYRAEPKAKPEAESQQDKATGESEAPDATDQPESNQDDIPTEIAAGEESADEDRPFC
jgi:hypothetical protein